jgi:hypothetical protein
MNHWAALPRSAPGGQCFYSDLAIETSLMLRLIFRQPLRQTEGLMASIFALLGVDLKAPDHSTASRRAMNLKSISKKCMVPNGPIHILIDSTRLKVFGAGEWLLEKHGKKSRRSWRKLHLAVDAETGQIGASILTEQDDDPSQVGPLLDQIEQEIVQVTADGAYDGVPTYETLRSGSSPADSCQHANERCQHVPALKRTSSLQRFEERANCAAHHHLIGAHAITKRPKNRILSVFCPYVEQNHEAQSLSKNKKAF